MQHKIIIIFTCIHYTCACEVLCSVGDNRLDLLHIQTFLCTQRFLLLAHMIDACHKRDGHTGCIHDSTSILLN